MKHLYPLVVAYYWLEDLARRLYWRIVDRIVCDQCAMCGRWWSIREKALYKGLCADCRRARYGEGR